MRVDSRRAPNKDVPPPRTHGARLRITRSISPCSSIQPAKAPLFHRQTGPCASRASSRMSSGVGRLRTNTSALNGSCSVSEKSMVFICGNGFCPGIRPKSYPNSYVFRPRTAAFYVRIRSAKSSATGPSCANSEMSPAGPKTKPLSETATS